VWSAVNKVEPNGESRVKLLDLGGKTFAAGVGEQRIYSPNVVKSGQDPRLQASISAGTRSRVALATAVPRGTGIDQYTWTQARSPRRLGWRRCMRSTYPTMRSIWR
jgi:hypothetical protein